MKMTRRDTLGVMGAVALAVPAAAAHAAPFSVVWHESGTASVLDRRSGVPEILYYFARDWHDEHVPVTELCINGHWFYRPAA